MALTLDEPLAISACIGEFGYAVVTGAVSEAELQRLKAEHLRAMHSLVPYPYPFGEQRRGEAPGVEHDFPETYRLLNTGPVQRVCAARGAVLAEDLVVWSTEHQHRSDAIYGRPHFDRRHQLKVFCYLTDTDVSNGALHVAREAPKVSEGRWLSAWAMALTQLSTTDARMRIEARATPERSSEYNSVKCEIRDTTLQYLPLEGPAGTLIFFDTTTPHFGGLVSGPQSRSTVRRHCILPA